jgi:hypothetical protein
VVHTLSEKVGNSHGLWQYKLAGTHERVILHGARSILDGTCRLLGFDGADRSTVYLFSFSAQPFPGFQVCVEKVREAGDAGCFYKVSLSLIGDFRARGQLPGALNDRYFRGWPEKIYLKLERSLTGEIVN